ncbi:MAG: energy transducer TonB [Bacteroidetes bacterium]|nr:energy transducer TonB [Bacteroidota bacterium]
MDAKKSPKADLETKKVLFIQFGLIIALTIVFFAFEWKSYDKRELDLGQREVVDIVEEIIPLTEQKVKPPPPPPPKQVTEIEVVEDDEIIEDDIDIDAEADEATEVEEYIPIEMEEEEIDEEHIFVIVEQGATFPGGEKARIRYLSSNINYPTMARESGIQGTVYVTFVVERDGSVTDVKITRGIGGGCDEEAVRVIRGMPKWIPGRQRNKPVRVQFNLPVRFTLQ